MRSVSSSILYLRYVHWRIFLASWTETRPNVFSSVRAAGISPFSTTLRETTALGSRSWLATMFLYYSIESQRRIHGTDGSSLGSSESITLKRTVYCVLIQIDIRFESVLIPLWLSHFRALGIAFRIVRRSLPPNASVRTRQRGPDGGVMLYARTEGDSNLLLARIRSWASLDFDPTKHSVVRTAKLL